LERETSSAHYAVLHRAEGLEHSGRSSCVAVTSVGKTSLSGGTIALEVNGVPILNALQPGNDAAITSIETPAGNSFRLGYTANGAMIVFSPSDTSE